MLLLLIVVLPFLWAPALAHVWEVSTSLIGGFLRGSGWAYSAWGGVSSGKEFVTKHEMRAALRRY